MAREYQEYRPSRSQNPKEQKPKRQFLKKIFKQAVFAVIIFSAIFLLKFSKAETISGYIKNAFLYEPDTTFITDTVKDIFDTVKKSPKKENTQNEDTKEPQSEEIL